MKTVSKSASKVALIATVLAVVARADSLWPRASAGTQTSMFADRKAAASGDILTIIVAESAAATSSQSTKSTRDSSLDDAISRFIYAGLATARRGQLPATSASGKATYSGTGDISNTQTVNSRASVLVTDVLPNGNLVIQGVRVVRFSGETQYVVLHGLVRPDDIARDNTVVSTSIADARVEFYGEGAMTDAQKQGWLAKIYEKLRPL